MIRVTQVADQKAVPLTCPMRARPMAVAPPLIGMWPRVRRLLGPHARREWELKLNTTVDR
jgi:hypothetical protein